VPLLLPAVTAIKFRVLVQVAVQLFLATAAI